MPTGQPVSAGRVQPGALTGDHVVAAETAEKYVCQRHERRSRCSAGGQTEVVVLGRRSNGGRAEVKRRSRCSAGGQTEVVVLGRRSNGGRAEVKRRSLRTVDGMRPPPERDAADPVLGLPEAGTNLRQTPRPSGQANPVTDLSATRIHVALTLDRFTRGRPPPDHRSLAEPAAGHLERKPSARPGQRPLSRTGDAHFRPPPDRGHPLARVHSAPCPHSAGRHGG